MAITGQARRRRIILNADAYISSATSKVPVLVKFNSTSHPDLFATGDDKDSVWFSSDASGQTTLYHEGVVFDTTDAIFYVRVDLSSTADTTIYFWYGTPAITGTESASDVWANGYAVYHFESATDQTSSVTGGPTLTKTGNPTAGTGVAGKGATSFSTSNYYVKSSPFGWMTGTRAQMMTKTVVAWSKVSNYTNTQPVVFATAGGSRGINITPQATTDIEFRFRVSDGRYGNWVYDSSSTDWIMVAGVLSGTTARYYAGDAGTISTSSTNTFTSATYSTEVLYIGGDNAGLYHSGVIDEVWYFNATKSADWLTAVYNNVYAYSTFVTIDGAVTIGSPPIQVYPVWSTTQALTEDIGVSSTSGVTLTSLSTYSSSISLSSNSAQSLGGVSTLVIGLTGVVNSSLVVEYGLENIEDIELAETSALVFSTITEFTQSLSLSSTSDVTLEIAQVKEDTIELETTSSLSSLSTIPCNFVTAIYVDTTSELSFEALIIMDTEEITLSTISSISVESDEFISISSTSEITTTVITSGSSKLLWDLEIINGETTYNLKDLNIIKEAEFTSRYGKIADKVRITLLNDGTYNSVFTRGNTINLYIYDIDSTKTLKFKGLITNVRYTLSNYDYSEIVITGMNYGAIRLNQTLIKGVEPYNNKTITEIITHMFSRYAPDITLNNVDTIAETIDSIRFEWIYLNQFLEELATIAGAYFYVDTDNDLHFNLLSTLSSMSTLNKTKILYASVEQDTDDTFDNIIVIGGKEHFIDVSNTTTTTALNLYEYYYASKFTPTKSNLQKLSIYCKKTGTPLNDLRFSIVEDNSGDPTGTALGYGYIRAVDISTDAAWVNSVNLEFPLDTTKTYWIMFSKDGTAEEGYQVYHDNSTANGHERSSDMSSWASQTGMIAFKTYYGIQIIKTSTATTKYLGNYNTDLAIIDFSIETTETSLKLAQQKLVEKAVSYGTTLTIIPSSAVFLPGNIITVNIDGLINDEQTIIETYYKIDEQQILTTEIVCTRAQEFYTAFANLYTELRKIQAKLVRETQEKGVDYTIPSETIVVTPTETYYEKDTDDDYLLGDDDFIFGVFTWG